ncbi:MAG: SpoIIIAH-like family protein [Clostridiales bacterium]|nr:SpoIIIAH-like family protein [Clostridiales bacterium]
MAANKKKIIILCTMVVLLIASGYLNYVLTSKIPDTNGGGDTALPTYFASVKAERQTTRNKEIAYYDAIIESDSATADAKAAAEAARIQLVGHMETESHVETFLFGKGYPAYLVSCTAGNINVIVVDNDLTATEVAEIKNFIIAQTGYVLKQIIISPYTV